MCLFEPLSPRKGALASKESDSHRHRAMTVGYDIPNQK
jgi:hypothetical protein